MSIKANIKFAVLSGAGSVFNVLVSIIRVKIVSNIIGASGVGVVGQLMNLGSISQFLASLGMENGVVAEVSRANAQKSSGTADQFRATFLLSCVVCSLILGAITFGFAIEISRWLLGDGAYAEYVRIMAAFNLTLGLVIPYNSFLSASKKVKEILVKSIVLSSLSTVTTVVLVLRMGIEGAVWSLLANGLINVLVSFTVVRKCGLPTYLSLTKLALLFSKERIASLLGYGIFLFSSSLIFQFVNLTVKRIILMQSDLDEMGTYQAMSNVTAQYLPVFVSSLSSYFLPNFSEKNITGDLKAEMNSAIRAILLLAIAPFLIMVSLSEQIISLLYSSEFLPGAQLLCILIGTSVFSIVNRFLLLGLLVQKQMKFMLAMDIMIAMAIPLITYQLYPTAGLLSPGIALALASIFHMALISWFLHWSSGFVLTSGNVLLLVLAALSVTILFFVRQDQIVLNFTVGVGLTIIIYSTALRKSELNSAIIFIKGKLKR